MRTLLFVLLVGAGALAVACGDGGGRPERTGIDAVDAIVAAALSGDARALEETVRYSSIPCEAPPRSLGGPPECEPGEAQGTKVDVLPVAQCEGHFLRGEQVGESLKTLVLSEPRLYAVYRAPKSWERGEYAVVFSVQGPERAAFGQSLVIEDGRLVEVDFGCAETAAGMVESAGEVEFVLPPP